MNTILSVNQISPQEVGREIARKVKTRRLEMNLTQEGVALRAGLKLPTYRRFERTGEISLHGLLQIAFAMNTLQDFDGLFAQRHYRTLDELLDEQESTRKRGRKNG